MSDRREQQEIWASTATAELLESWREMRWDLVGEVDGIGEPAVKRAANEPKHQAHLHSIAQRYNLVDDKRLKAALGNAIDGYFIYWIENAFAATTGFCSKKKANKFVRTLRSLLEMMDDPQLMARLQVGADQVWPGEIGATRQMSSMFLVDDPDACVKSPTAFRFSARWFELTANAGAFDASKRKRFDSGDVKIAAEVLLAFYKSDIDPNAKFFMKEEFFSDVDRCGLDDSERSKSAFDFVFQVLRLIDDTVTPYQLKDFALDFKSAIYISAPGYDPAKPRIEQLARVFRENAGQRRAIPVLAQKSKKNRRVTRPR